MGRRPNPDTRYDQIQQLIRKFARVEVESSRLAEVDAVYRAALQTARATVAAIVQHAPRSGKYQYLPDYCGFAWLIIPERFYDNDSTAALCRLGHVSPHYEMAMHLVDGHETEGMLWVAEAGCAAAASVFRAYLGHSFEIYSVLD